MTTSGSRSSTDANMRGPGSTMGNVDNTLQANLLRNNNNLSDSEEEDSKEEPPPYSRYDPLSQQPPQQPPRPQYPQQGPWIPPSQLGNTGYLQPPSNSQHRPSQSSSPQNNGSNGRWFAPNAPNQPLSSTQSPPSPAIPRPPFQYPPGYFCPKCHNTGFKIYNGSPCGTCARLFGRQSANVRIEVWAKILTIGEIRSRWLFCYSTS